MNDSKNYAVSAEWLVPVDGEPIRDGAVVIDAATNRIVSVGTQASLQKHNLSPSNEFSLGNAVLIPGWINAHTHLEFSDLSKPLGRPGMPFTDWLRSIVVERNRTPHRKARAICSGLNESFANGVWAVGEIASAPVTDQQYQVESPADHVHCTIFHEQLGRDPQSFDEKKQQAAAFLATGNSPQIQRALSPHAPYSTHPNVVRQLCKQATGQNACVAMHLAETREERQLLDEQSGPFVELLKSFRVWNPESFQPPVSVSDILKMLAAAPRSLVIHGNYLTESEIDLISQHKDRMSIVFCPRTHNYFQHDHYPLSEIMARGINLAVGTDSRASNPDLKIIDELRHVHRTFGQLDPQRLMEMGTLNGATALGIDDQFGSLTPGKTAALSIVQFEEQSAIADPFFWLRDSTTVSRPVVDGRIVLP